MRYLNGDRVGLPMLDTACRSQMDGSPMPRILVQRGENAGETCRVLQHQMLPLGAITTARPDGDCMQQLRPNILGHQIVWFRDLAPRTQQYPYTQS